MKYPHINSLLTLLFLALLLNVGFSYAYTGIYAVNWESEVSSPTITNELGNDWLGNLTWVGTRYENVSAPIYLWDGSTNFTVGLLVDHGINSIPEGTGTSSIMYSDDGGHGGFGWYFYKSGGLFKVDLFSSGGPVQCSASISSSGFSNTEEYGIGFSIDASNETCYVFVTAINNRTTVMGSNNDSTLTGTVGTSPIHVLIVNASTYKTKSLILVNETLTEYVLNYLHTPTISKTGSTFNFGVQSVPDTSADWLVYANLTCALSVPQQQVSNQLLSYDVGTHIWQATGISAPACTGSYFATYFGTSVGEAVLPTSVYGPSPYFSYNLTLSNYTWKQNTQYQLTLNFYDTSSYVDITQNISRNANNSLNVTLTEIIDPNDISHPIEFLYNSVTKKYEANYTSQNLLCSGIYCEFAKDYLMNLTGISLVGYINLNVRITYTTPLSTIAGTYYFDKDKSGSLTTSDSKLSGYTVHLTKSLTQTITGPESYSDDTTTTSATGNFSFTNVPDGNYTLWFEMAGSRDTPYIEFINNYYNMINQHAYITLIVSKSKNGSTYTNYDEGREIVYDSVGNISMKLATQGSMVNFTVTNSTNDKVSGMNVKVNYDSGISKTCTTDANGNCFVIVMMPISGCYGCANIGALTYEVSGGSYSTTSGTISVGVFSYTVHKYTGTYIRYSANTGGGARFVITDLNGTLNQVNFNPISVKVGEEINNIYFKIKDLQGYAENWNVYKFSGQNSYGLFVSAPYTKATAVEAVLHWSATALQRGYLNASTEGCVASATGWICDYECSNVIGGCACYISIDNHTYTFNNDGVATLSGVDVNLGENLPFTSWCSGPLLPQKTTKGIDFYVHEINNNQFTTCSQTGLQTCFIGSVDLTVPDGCYSPTTDWTKYFYANYGTDVWSIAAYDPTQVSPLYGGSAVTDLAITCNQTSSIGIRLYDYQDVDKNFSFTFGAGTWTEDRYKVAHLDNASGTLNVTFNITSSKLGIPVNVINGTITITELNSSATFDMAVSGNQLTFTYYGVTDPAGTQYHYALEVNADSYTFNDTSNTSNSVIYSSIDHYSDVNCALEPAVQLPGQPQLAYCKFKTVNGSTVTQTSNLQVKVDKSIGNAELLTNMPFERFDGDYNYYSASVVLMNYTISPSGVRTYNSISSPAEGTIKMYITDPNNYYPNYVMNVNYRLDNDVISVEPAITGISLNKDSVIDNNIKAGDNVICTINISDSQNKIYNATFDFWGGNRSAVQSLTYTAQSLLSTLASYEITGIDRDGAFGLTDSSQICCRGTVYYDWAGLRKTLSESTCRGLNSTGPGTTPVILSSGNLLDLGSITSWVTANPLQFVLLMLLIIVLAPILMMLLR